MKFPVFFHPFNWRLFTALLGGAGLLSACLQLYFGTSPILIFLVVLASMCGLYAPYRLGVYNTGGWAAFIYVFGSVLAALIAKTLMGQPLESNLYAPVKAYSAMVLVSMELLIALFCAHFIPLGRPLFKPDSKKSFLSFLSWCCFFASVFAWALIQYSFAFAGLSLFRYLIVMAVVARTALLLEKSGDRRSFDVLLGLILLVAIGLGLLSNQKMMAALPIASYFVTVFFFSNGLPSRHIRVLVSGVIVFVLFATPMIQSMRIQGFKQKSLQQKLTTLRTTSFNLVRHPFGTRKKMYSTLLRIKRNATSRYLYHNYHYFGPLGEKQALLGRYAMVQYIDPVLLHVDEYGTWGGTAIWGAFHQLLPNSIFPGTPRYGEPYRIKVYYQVQGWWAARHPVLPISGQAYAAYGVMGLLFIPMLTFMAFFLVLKKLGWSLHRNIYAIFFFCNFVMISIHQYDFKHFAAAILRNMPLFAIAFLCIALAYRVLTKSLAGKPLYFLYPRKPLPDRDKIRPDMKKRYTLD